MLYKLKDSFISNMVQKRLDLIRNRSCGARNCSTCVVCEILRMKYGTASFDSIKNIGDDGFLNELKSMKLRVCSGGLKVVGDTNEYKEVYSIDIAYRGTICRL